MGVVLKCKCEDHVESPAVVEEVWNCNLDQRGEYWMTLMGFCPEEPLCEFDVLFAGGDTKSIAGAVAGAGLMGRWYLLWASLEE